MKENRAMLFTKMLQVGCVGFGGGSALVPVLEKYFVKSMKVESKKEYDRDVIVASITPGALPVEISSSIGKKAYGNLGMILCAVGMALPGVLIGLAMFAFFQTYADVLFRLIAVFSILSSAFITSLLGGYIRNTVAIDKKKNRMKVIKTYLVVIGAFSLVAEGNVYKLLGIEQNAFFSLGTFHVLVCAFFFAFYARSTYSIKHVAVILVLVSIYLLGHGKGHVIQNSVIMQIDHAGMLLFAVYGLVKSMQERNCRFQIQKKELAKTCCIWVVFMFLACLPALCVSLDGMTFMGKGMLSSLMSFGGGDAYLTVADGLFVDTGIVPEDVFYGQIVTIVNVLPGSILCKVLSLIGYYYGFTLFRKSLYGFLFAISGFAISVGMSCFCYHIVHYLYDSISEVAVVKTISRWIRPIMAGLLCNVILSLVLQVKKAGARLGLNEWATFGFFAVCILVFSGIRFCKRQIQNRR